MLLRARIARRLSAAGLLSALVLALAVSAPAASAPRATLPIGADMTATTNNHLNSGSAKVGDPITMTVGQPYPSNGSGLAGAVIYGKVIVAQPAGQGRNPKLEIGIYRIKYASGSSASMSAKIDKIDVKQKSNLAKEAGGAVAGMLIGNWIGKAIGTNLGGAVGAVGGYMLTSNSKTNFDVPTGSKVYLELTQPLAVY